MKQLDQTHPELAIRQTGLAAVSADAPAPHFDVAAVVKASQALSGRIELAKPIDEQDLHRVLLKWIATCPEDVDASHGS